MNPTSRIPASTLLRFLLLLTVVASVLGQSENEPYFALSSNRTFGSGGTPSVGLSAWNIDSLEFRVYRVQDPLRFFREIEDPHQFGGRAPAPPRERTLLERIHRWKRSLRAGIRRTLRAQFTESPRSHVDAMFPRRSAPVAVKGTRYAEAPLLNQQQMVLSFVQPVHSQTRWDRQNVDIGVREKGVYLVEAVRRDLRAYTILIVSDIVMISKVGRGRLVNLVVDRRTGQPLEGVPIAALTRDADAGGGKTDADGVAEFRPEAAKGADLRLVAHRDRDFAVNTVPGGPFGLALEQWTGFLYTDRPVYRPGHTVHFKGILRLRNATGYDVPAGRSVTVAIQDPDQKPIYQKSLTATANGTIRDDVTLPAGAALGYYFIEVKAGEAFMSGSFQVEDYKKPEYEVRVTPVKARVLQGEPVEATVDARYYFGEPVVGAKVKYAVYRERYWLPFWYDEDEGDAEPDGEPDDGGDQVNEQDAMLDAEGKLTVRFPTAVSDRKFDYRYRVEARVTDAANREITGRGWAVATYGSYALNVEPERYFYAPHSVAAITVMARNYENAPVRTRAMLELRRWNRRDRAQGEVVSTATVDIGADGSGRAVLDMPAQSGSYRVRAISRTPEGREVEAQTSVWVSGGAAWDTGRGQDHTVSIIPDKKTYRAGETAHLMIVAGQPNTPVYVTVEGLDLRQHKLIRSPESTLSFDLPVTAEDEPGIMVSAGYVRGGAFYNGSKYVRVPPIEHQLQVKLATDKAQYLPGQTAEYQIDVAGKDGKPVPRAEFSLGVVDEAIYGVRRDTTQDIVRFFFGNDWNRVFTDTSLEYYFSGEAGQRRMRLADIRAPSRLAQLKPERLAEPKVRKAFPDTAFWAADMVTDGSGRAHAKVAFPDSLTTWRATVRGATPDTRVGSATLKTIVRKNVILRLSTPRFFVQGDEVVVSALVHNYLPTAKTARVSLEATGLELLEGATREVQIASRGEAKVDWRFRARQVRTARLVAKALTDEESDALELDLPVNVPGVKLARANGGSLAAGASAAFDLAFPGGVQPGSRSLAIRVSPSIAGSLFAALDYLTTFPYGCVEQTMSSFLPNIVVQQAVRTLGVKLNMDQAALDEKIRAGLDRLRAFQHEDGGWGWWETDESQHFMTAYVVAGLAQARAGGVTVQPEMLERGSQWVRKALAADPGLAGDLRAYMVYALASAGAADSQAANQLYGRRRNLSPYGLALLGLAMEQSKDGRAAEIAGEIERAAQQDDQQAWWPASRDEMLDFSVDATPEATAYAAKLLAHQKRDSALLPKAALWLMNHRNEGYWWASTKQTAMVIYGLTDYLQATNELKPNLTATVTVNGRQVWTRHIEQASDGEEPEIVLDESRLEPGSNHIAITTSGAGRLYYSARAEYFSNEERAQNAGSVSLNILRDYFRLSAGREGDRIVYDTIPLNGPVSPGDIIAVRLTVTGSDWRYMMVEDPIPSGAEFIERDSVYELRNRPPWWQYNFTRRELHDDRMAIFQTHFPQGQQQYFYLLKVVNPGAFEVSPARVQPMYQPGVTATTGSRRLEVK